MPNESKQARRPFSLSILVRVFLTVMIVVSVAVFINSVMRYNELLVEQRDLEQNKAVLIEEKENLQELLDSENSDQYVIRMARKFWGLFFPDEEIYFNNHNSN